MRRSPPITLDTVPPLSVWFQWVGHVAIMLAVTNQHSPEIYDNPAASASRIGPLQPWVRLGKDDERLKDRRKDLTPTQSQVKMSLPLTGLPPLASD